MDAHVDLGFIDFAFNLTDTKLAEATADQECKMLRLSQTEVQFNLCNLELLNITTGEYTLISDPPLFTDIGDNYLSLAKLSATTTFSPRADADGGLHLDFAALDFDLGFDFQAYGISDMSRVFTNTVHYMVDLVFGRFKSMVDHQYPVVKQEIEDALANLLVLPRKIDLGDDLVFDGGFVKQPVMGKGWGSLPITYFLDSASNPNPNTQHDQIPYYKEMGEY